MIGGYYNVRSTENKVNIIAGILVAIAAIINIVILTTTQFELIEYPILLGVMLSVLIVVEILLILQRKPRKKKLTAPSGRKPTEEERRDVEEYFPGLIYCNWHVTALKDCKYNCIEWSLSELQPQADGVLVGKDGLGEGLVDEDHRR